MFSATKSCFYRTPIAESSVGGSEEEPTEVFYAAVNYEASKADEVSFVRGEKIEVLKKSLLGWWTVRLANYM